jgi:hypothetical protein
MANTVLLKRSSVAGKVPTTLEYGEVTINYTDGVLWYKTSANTITRINSAVDGSTVNGVAYLGSANVLVNSAGLTFNPSGNVLAVGGNIVAPNYLFANGVNILSTVASSYDNANVAAYLLTATGNIQAGKITAAGHVLPSANVTYDLGSPTQRWKDLYLSGNTMVLGQANIQAHNSGITIYAPNQTVNLNQNLHTTATPSFANITATGNLIVNARLRDYTGNAGINGQLLASTGTGVQWVSRDTGSLASLSDVNLSDPYVQQVLTYDGTNWVNADSNAVVASAVFASSQSDLGSVTDLVLTITEDEGLVTDVATTIYDLGVLSFTGIISLNNIDQSIKSDYLGYSIIFGF